MENIGEADNLYEKLAGGGYWMIIDDVETFSNLGLLPHLILFSSPFF